VVPMALTNLWGSFFSRIERKAAAWPAPKLPPPPSKPVPEPRKTVMKKQFAAVLVAVCTAFAGVAAPLQAQAQSDASVALSMMPVASVLVAGSAVGASATAVVAVPAALSAGGSTLAVVAVEASADGTVYVLERASDGARASIKVAGRATRGVSNAVGTSVLVTVIGSGVVLSAAGEVLAFVPNAIGRALLYNERLS
jgi:zona occludens toxin (predicted ATPase)